MTQFVVVSADDTVVVDDTVGVDDTVVVDDADVGDDTIVVDDPQPQICCICQQAAPGGP